MTTNRRFGASTLLDLAIESFRNDIAPALPPDKRYAGAMMASALEIARRDIIVDGEEAEWKLLDTLYDDGEGSLQQLAADIRAGTLDEAKKPGLHKALLDYVTAELKVLNPRFLKARQSD